MGGLPRLWGPRVGWSRHLWRVVALVRRPWVVGGGVWQWCIVLMVGGGLWAGMPGGSVVGYRLVAGAGAGRCWWCDGPGEGEARGYGFRLVRMSLVDPNGALFNRCAAIRAHWTQNNDKHAHTRPLGAVVPLRFVNITKQRVQ